MEQTFVKLLDDVGVKSTLHLILVLWQLNKAMF